MVTQYPAKIDDIITLPVLVDGVHAINVAVINRLREAIIAIEEELGESPASIYTNVRERLDNLDAIFGSLQTISLAGDLGNNHTTPRVIGIRGIPVSSATPLVNQVLTFNGTSWSPTNLTGGVSTTFTAAGDLSGTDINQTVIGLQTRPISSSAPSAGDVLTWNGSAWAPEANASGGSGIEIVPDLITRDAIPSNEREEGMLVYVLDNGMGPAYYQLGAGLTNADWALADFVNSLNIEPASVTTGPIAGTSLTVSLATLGGKLIVNGIDSSAVSDSDQGVIYYDLSENKFKVSENGGAYVDLLGGGGGSVTWAGDLAGSTDTSQTVIAVNGATIPAAGSLTTDHILKVSGSSALSYGYIVNANVDSSAAIAYSKLALSNSIVNADVSASAAIAGSKISPNFGSQQVVTTGDVEGATITIGASGPEISAGSGVPASSPPNGSIYLRTDGTSTTGLYTRQGGAWSAIGGGGGGGGGGSGSIVPLLYSTLSVDTATNSNVFSDLLSIGPFTTEDNTVLEIRATYSGIMYGESYNNWGEFVITVDGTQQGGGSTLYQDPANSAMFESQIASGAISKFVPVSAGSHTVKLRWRAIGTNRDLQIRAATRDGEHASLSVNVTSANIIELGSGGAVVIDGDMNITSVGLGTDPVIGGATTEKNVGIGDTITFDDTVSLSAVIGGYNNRIGVWPINTVYNGDQSFIGGGADNKIYGYNSALVGAEQSEVSGLAMWSLGQGFKAKVDFANIHTIATAAPTGYGITRSQRNSWLMYGRITSAQSMGWPNDSNGNQFNFYTAGIEDTFMSVHMELIAVLYPTTSANTGHWRKVTWDLLIHVDDSGNGLTNPAILAGSTPIVDQSDGDGASWTVQLFAESGILYPRVQTGGGYDVLLLCKVDYMEISKPI